METFKKEDIPLVARAKMKYPTVNSLRTKKWIFNGETIAILYQNREGKLQMTKKGKAYINTLLDENYISADEAKKRILSTYLTNAQTTTFKISSNAILKNYLAHNFAEILNALMVLIKSDEEIKDIISED